MIIEKNTIISNRYRVEAHLGSGGMADVYKVWDKQRSAYLAMKVLKPDLAEDKVFIRRFQREGENLSRLQHPNIVRFYGMEKDGILVYLLMDYVEGISLRTEIAQKEDPIGIERILDMMNPVFSALRYAHNEGIIHCDVKPANIMLEQSGRILLADFGIARMTEGATTMTMAGAGTPAYMAPEQIRGEEPGSQSDIYSLGIVLYEMLTGGERPFTGEQASITGTTGEKLRWEKMNLAPTSPRVYNPRISRELEAVVMKCLEREPNRRYDGALDLLEALQRCLPVQGSAKRSQQEPEPEQKPVVQQPVQKEERVKPKQKFHWWQFALGGALLVIVLLLLRTGKTHGIPAMENPEPAIAIVEATDTEVPEATPTHTPMPTSTPEPTFTPTPSLGIGSTQVSPKDGMVMMYIPAGEFSMGFDQGNRDERPIHTVYLDAYWIDKTEVTNDMYQQCVIDGICSVNKDYGSDFNGDNQPVVGVDWNQADTYCKWGGKELPTEAQWEKAAVGPNVHYWGAGFSSKYANIAMNIGRTTDVGNYPEGGYGALDMAGNVWEWVSDWYSDSYYKSQTTWENPSGPSKGLFRVFRGGSWYYGEVHTYLFRFSYRNKNNPVFKLNDLGFRCVSASESP